MNMNKEYGGYFSLDFKWFAGGGELFSEINEEDKIRMNAARYAIVYSVLEGQFSRIYIPIYMCESIKDALERYHINYSFYNIDEELEPVLESIDSDECILVCNYFGLKGREFYGRCISKYTNVIFDNTQCLYTQPILEDHIYNVYSPRKFVSVSDGAYLIKKGLYKKKLEKSFSSEHAGFLLKSIEEGTNAGYAEYLQSEDRISQEGMREMSMLTRNILGSFDYDNAKKKRNGNFRALHDLLGAYNGLCIECTQESYPMVYPFLTDDDNLRGKLVSNKIYIPQWWKWILSTGEANLYERRLSKYLLPLPIDHRYDIEDMEAIAKLTLS